MTNARPVTLYTKTPAGVAQSAFSFERSALACAREQELAQFVIAINGRILHWEGVSDPHAFIR